MISQAEQSAIARNLEPQYNAELERGAAPGIFGVSFRVPSPGMLEVTLHLTGLTMTRPYVCDGNDTANEASYRKAVDWCYREALAFSGQPVTFEMQCAMVENAQKQMKAALPTMPELSDIQLAMTEKDLFKISMVTKDGIRMARNYRATPEDNRNFAAFTAFLNRAFNEFSSRPKKEIQREVEAQMGVRRPSPWWTVLKVIGAIVLVASGIGIIFLIFALIVGASLNDNNGRGRRRKW